MDLKGIHHLTAISAQIRENHRFYTQTLGMRLVKRSIIICAATAPQRR